MARKRIDSPRATQLAAQLRAARKAARLTQEKVATAIGRQHSHVSRWENHELIPTDADMGALCQVLGITGKERDDLITLARDTRDERGSSDWLAPGIDQQLVALMNYERKARLIVDVEPMLVPGLLQTPNYARAIMVDGGIGPELADQRVVVRMGRQRIVLSRKPPFQLTAVIGEGALRDPAVETETMAEQLQHLIGVAENPIATVQVLPTGARFTAAREGAFVLLEFDDGTNPIVYREGFYSDTTLTDDVAVSAHQAALEVIRREAMSPEDSARLIAGLIDKMESTS